MILEIQTMKILQNLNFGLALNSNSVFTWAMESKRINWDNQSNKKRQKLY